MKRMNKVILAAITILFGILATNIFMVREYQRLRNFGKSEQSLEFYIRDARIDQDDFIGELYYLSDKYGLSFLKANNKDSIYYKALVVDEESFPYDKFDGKFDLDSSPKNFPSFMNIGKIRLVGMGDYFEESGDSISGEYSIIGENRENLDSLLEELSQFLSISKEELLSKPYETGFTYINNASIFSAIGLFIAYVLLVISSIYRPLFEMRKIGVEKLLGISSFDILKSYLLEGLLTIVITSLVFDLGIYAINSYIPSGFMRFLILSQSLIIISYLIIEFFSYNIIDNITISKMIKKFTSLRWVNALNFTFKLAISVFAVASLYLLSLSFNLTFDSLNQAKFYVGNSQDYLANEYGRESASRLSMKSTDLVKLPYHAYKKLNARIDDLNYIYYDTYTPFVYDDTYDQSKTYEILNVNDTYLKKLGLKISDKKNTIYIPKTMSYDKNLDKAFRYYLTYIKDANNIDMDEVSNTPINIIYYDKDIQSITYNEEKPIVNDPIIALVDDYNMNFKHKLFLLNTGIESPLKIKNTKENRQIIEDVYDDYQGEYYLKFSSISSIMKEVIDEYRLLIAKTSSIFIILTLLSFFISFVLIQGYFLTKNRFLNVSKLMGYRLFDRFKSLIAFVGTVDLISLASLYLTSRNFLVALIFLAYAVIDFILIFAFIRAKDRKSLVNELKGV
ncbi:MAG: DUF1430 domain-containing protein [Anaerococcus sp.]|nr:DUF1430 domain-containing protein [Anaerococcus sp.]